MTETVLDRYEKYLRGEPLTPELAALRQGAKEAADAPKADANDAPWMDEGDVQRELNREERLALKEMVVGRGWPVMLRLLERTFQMSEKAAIAFSQQSPLQNKDAIAERWAQHQYFGIAKTLVEQQVMAEVRALDSKKPFHPNGDEEVEE